MPTGPPLKAFGDQLQIALVEGVQARAASTSSRVKAASATRGVDAFVSRDRGKIAYPLEQTACDARGAARLSGNFACAILRQIEPQHPRAALDGSQSNSSAE